MSQNQCSLTIKNIVIDHYPDGRIIQITVEGQPLSQFVQPLLGQIRIRFDFRHPERTMVQLPEGIKKLIISVCDAILELKNDEKHCLAGYLATSCFEALTSFPNSYMINAQYVVASSYWSEILTYVRDWESKHNAKIHKGHPYFFLAFAYLLSGDLDTGFVYAYNAIKDDEALGRVCPHLNYPQEAPIYQTALMLDDKPNAMDALVRELRQELEQHIATYRTEFLRSFSIQDFDTKFLRNTGPDLENLRYLFVFCFWSLADLRKKTSPEILLNDFSRLRNLNLIFNLCLLIDKLLEANPKVAQDSMGSNVMKVCNIHGWLSQSELNELEIGYKIDVNEDDPDKILKILMPMNLIVRSRSIPKEAIHYLIAWNLRNYGGHNIIQQNSLVDKFDEIFHILVRCVILSVDVL
jgi:hypothetical protein